MPVEKDFDPTLPRTGNQAGATDVPLQHDDIDIDVANDDILAAPSTPGTLFTDTDSASLDAPMPPPLVGESDASPPLLADEQYEEGVKERAQALAENVKEKLAGADDRVRAFVEQRPFVALAGAAAAGFLIGRLVSRI